MPSKILIQNTGLGGRIALAGHVGVLHRGALAGMLAADDFTAKLRHFERILGELKTRKFKNLTDSDYADLLAILAEFTALDHISGKMTMLRDMFKRYFRDTHDFTAISEAIIANDDAEFAATRTTILAALQDVHDIFYNADGSTKTLPASWTKKNADFNNLKQKIIALIQCITDNCDAAPRPLPVIVDIDLEFDIDADLPRAHDMRDFDRINKENAKNIRATLLYPPAATPTTVNIREVLRDVHNGLYGKSGENSFRSSKASSSLEDRVASSLVFDQKIQFRGDADNMFVGRQSHEDPANVYDVCRINQNVDGAIVIKSSDLIVNAPSITQYEAGHEEEDVSDRTAEQAVLKAAVIKTAKALIGTDRDHRFAHIRKRAADGRLITKPTVAQIEAIINMAYTIALPHVIPLFDAPLKAHLDRYFTGHVAHDADLKRKYDLILAIQTRAASKQPADLEEAYRIFVHTQRPGPAQTKMLNQI